MSGPLTGVRVLEFSEIIAAPFGGMLLADMGAEVIKVEPPWGEPWRLNSQFVPLESKTYISINRGKKSLPLDLSKPAAREIVGRLVPRTDVVIVNYRPDVPAKLGIDYEALSALNPRLIYCETTAFGRHGPESARPGYDIVIQAMSGLMAMDGHLQGGVPQVITPAVADFSTGIAIAWAVSAALYNRERTGQGQRVDTSLLGTALGLQANRFLWIEATDTESRQSLLEGLTELRSQGKSYQEMQEHHRAHTFTPLLNIYYRTYQTRDSVIAVGCLSDPLRKKLLSVLGLHDIRFDAGYDAGSDEALAFAQALHGKAEAIFRQRSAAEWLRDLDAAGVPAGPVRFPEELVDDPQVLANGFQADLDHSLVGRMKMTGPLVQMSETPLEATASSPALGEHTDDLLRDLGYSADDVQGLRDAGVTR